MKFKDIPMPTLVTGFAGIAWLGSFGLRALKPDFALGPAADTLMATCTAWWMKTRRDANGGQDDLLTEVVSKVGMPYISTAHAEEPGPAKPAYAPAPYTPKPTQPYAPKPAPKKPGGLPWA